MLLPKWAALFLCFVLLGSFMIATVQAAPGGPGANDAVLLTQLASASGATPQVFRHAETGKVRFLELPPAHPLSAAPSLLAPSPEQAARAFLTSYGSLFGISAPAQELQLMQQETLPGRNFVRFQQHYQGVPVMGGELIVQSDAQRAVVSASGEALPDLNLSVVPRITADAAATAALIAIGKAYKLPAADLQASAPRLWIFNPALLGGPGARISRLVWRTELTPGVRAAGEPIRELALIDAQTGALALHFNQIADAKKRVVCNDNNQIDADGNQDNNCTPADYVRVEGQGPSGSDDVDLAYDYAGMTYDYYYQHFRRDSLDGKGMTLISLVKYCPDAQNCPFQNANWDGHQMTYGEGFASADDVVGHELSHAITEFTSHLYYYYQSGAINESMSDVFGELIDQTDGAGNDSNNVRWLLGEDLPPSIGAIRDMRDPGAFQNPDRMTSPFYTGDAQDRGGVHSNSGVNNKAAYLMTDGDNFNGYNIRGLGANKVGGIYYTVQSAFLTSGSDYEDLSNALPAACASLAASGTYGITSDDCQQVQKAVFATEMNLTPPAAPVEEAAVCAPGQTSKDAFYEDFEHPSDGTWQASVLQGQGGWYYPSSNNPYGADVTFATSGEGNLWGDAIGSFTKQPLPPSDYVAAMTRSITVPPNAYMHFRHSFDFEADATTYYDGGVVEYSTNGGGSWQDAGTLFTDRGYNATIDDASVNPLHGRDAFGSVSQGYLSSRLDLSSLAGQQVRFRFRIGTDSFIGTEGWFVDDMRIYTCSNTPPQAALLTQNTTVAPTGVSFTVQLRMNGVTDHAVTVPFVVGGTAVPNTHYRLVNSSFVVTPGSADGRVVIQFLPGSAGRTLTLTLGTPSGATLGARRSVTITVQGQVGTQTRKVFVPLARR